MRSTARGPFFHVPMSRLAAWSGRLGVFAFVVAVFSIIIVRSGILEIEPALATFAAALIFAALAILLAFAAFVAIWRQGLGGLGRAVAGLFLGILLLTYPGYFAYRGSKLPAIHDITTDPSDPPRFGVLARLRPRGSDAYPGAKTAALQRKAYPDLDTLEYANPAAMVYRVVLKVVTKRKWHIVDAVAPAPQRDGTIEAVARTPIMGFRDDVVVRVRASQEGTLIDVRSASRYGVGDFGTNARRVAALLADIDDAMTGAVTEPVGPAPKSAVKSAPKKKPQAPAKRPKR
jgi:uncharacterized protein (DUF1499 family)/uncharacterized membrane protein